MAITYLETFFSGAKGDSLFISVMLRLLFSISSELISTLAFCKGLSEIKLKSSFALDVGVSDLASLGVVGSEKNLLLPVSVLIVFGVVAELELDEWVWCLTLFCTERWTIDPLLEECTDDWRFFGMKHIGVQNKWNSRKTSLRAYLVFWIKVFSTSGTSILPRSQILNSIIMLRPENKIENPSLHMRQSIQEWTKLNLWRTVFKKFEVIWSA